MVYIGLASQNDNPCVRGGVFALNPWSGKVVWVHYAAVAGVVGRGVWSSVTAVPELHAIIATTGNPCTEHTPTYQEDSIVGLDWTTGATLWPYNAVAYDDCGCELGEGAVDVTLNGEHYFIAGNKFGSVYALKLQGKGVKLVWSRRVATIDSSSKKLFGGIFEPPAYSDGNVFVAGGATLDGKCVGTLSSMRATTGAVNWSICTSSRTFSPAASSGGSLFVGGSNIVTGYDMATGQVLWQAHVDGGTWGGIAISHGFLVIGTSRGNLYCYSLSGGAH